MQSNQQKMLPSILRYLQLSAFIMLILYFGQVLFIPMFYGFFIAMVMYPVCKWLEAKHLNRSMAIAASLSMVTLLFVVLIALLGWQFSTFRRELPALMDKVKPMIPSLQLWLERNLSITVKMQESWLQNTTSNITGNTNGWIQDTFSSTISTLFALFLVPIHAALFLYHRGTFVRFLHKIAGEKLKIKTDSILRQTIHTYFNYIKGMVLVYIIVGILNSLGLILLGVKHAILFGMLTAIMTIIPYVGIIVSASLPVSIAFITTNSIWYPLGVILVFSFVQYLEANVIFPKIVGTQLNVGTWATFIAIIGGGIIWGVSGMILFIPFVSILKIISENVEELKAINILLSRD